MAEFAHPDSIRARFCAAMSAMYRAEVPLYGDLIDIVETVNAATLARNPCQEEATRVGGERHGAIRLGTREEVATIRRAFAVMGMHPVGYYDLAPAGVPVHSTAFRPIEPASLARSPFRMFTSLLRLDLIADADLRAEARAILSLRRIFAEPLLALINRHESEGGLTEEEAGRFIELLTDVFRWHSHALVDAATYRRLVAAHPLIADIVAFRGPHINHLTPRTLDIDAAHAAMIARGMKAKKVIEGPPRRAAPILLRQTSFAALEEPIFFAGKQGDEAGSHTARFGEIEARGVALTRSGRARYDEALHRSRNGDSNAFDAIPDDLDALRRDGLAWFSYRAADPRNGPLNDTDPEVLIASGALVATPILYEDFLPVSAAGIFRSNLGDMAAEAYAASSAQDELEDALGVPVIDMFDCYARSSASSLHACGLTRAAELLLGKT